MDVTVQYVNVKISDVSFPDLFSIDKHCIYNNE